MFGHHRDNGWIKKNKGKQITQWQQPLLSLDMPAIFITPKPNQTHIPQILKDQAKANKKDKAHHTHCDHNKSPSWDDLPDSWDFNNYNHWDINPTTN